MKKLLPIILGLALAGSASAQTVTPSEIPTATIAIDPSWNVSEMVKPFPSASAPAAENIKLSYYNPDGQLQNWQGPVALNAQTFIAAYAQRFTLPASSGLLDSTRIMFTSVQDLGEGQINILIVKANLIDFPEPSPDFYLPDLSQTGLLGQASVPAAVMAGNQNFWLTITTAGLEVPQQFFVYVAPSFGTTTNTS